MSADPGEVERARGLVAAARRVLFLTGAGVSAESGVPTFRQAGVAPGGDSPEPLWALSRPEDLATPGAFARDPVLVWSWYAWRRDLVRGCAPNPAHRAIARYLCGHPRSVLVTQNVDGLHERAAEEAAAELGVAAPGTIAFHGGLFVVRCAACGLERTDRSALTITATGSLPRCAACGGLERPGVVWFGEGIEPRVLRAASEAAAQADVVVIAGTSGVVEPAAGLARAVCRHGGRAIEINPHPTPLTDLCAVTLRSVAGEVLPALLGGRSQGIGQSRGTRAGTTENGYS